MNTAACRSAITFIDGDKGHPPLSRLPDRAAGRAGASFLEVAWLLRHGELPTQAELRRLGARDHATTRTSTRTSRSSCRASATTRTRCGCCSAPWRRSRAFYPDAKNIQDPAEPRHPAACGSSPRCRRIAAFMLPPRRRGCPSSIPDNDLDYIENFLIMVARHGGAEVRGATRCSRRRSRCC